MRCDHYTMREKENVGASFPADLRGCLVKTIDGLGPGEVLAALRREEHAADNFDALIAARLAERLPPEWRLRRGDRVVEGTAFKNDFSLLSATGVVCVEIEKGQRGRFDLDLIKLLAFAARHAPLPAFGAIIVSSRKVLPRDVGGSRRETAFAYLERTLRLLWRAHRANLEDVLVVGYDEGEQADDVLIETAETTGRARPDDTKDITEGTQGLDEEGIARMLAGRAAGVARACVALHALRAAVRRRVPAATEKLNRKLGYLGYRTGGRDRAYVHLRSSTLEVETDLPRSDEEVRLFRDAGLEVRHRGNFQGKAGWITGIRLPCGATPEQTAVVAQAIVRALTADGSGGLFRDPGD